MRTDTRRLNPYYISKWDLHTSIPVSGKQRPVLGAFEQYRDEHLRPERQVSSSVVAELAGTAREVIRSYVELVRELEFESIRRDEFPDLPSRKHCLWASETFEDAARWVATLTPGKSVQIVRLQVVTAKIHLAFGGHLYSPREGRSLEASNMTELQEAARGYWRGTPHARGEAELLMEGEFKVLEVVSSSRPSS